MSVFCPIQACLYQMVVRSVFAVSLAVIRCARGVHLDVQVGLVE